MRKFKALALAGVVLSFQIHATDKIKVIYGEDNRREVVEETNSVIVELVRSTAAMIPKTSLSSDSNGWNARDTGVVKVQGGSLIDRGICASERFSSQVTAATCSGFLVDEKTIVTAGHCMTEKAKCSDYSWVFDYKLDTATATQVYVTKENIYNCKKIVKQVLDLGTLNDYSVIELDRAVKGRRPLAFRKSGKIGVGANLFVVGHPSGLPTKIAGGAKVRTLKDAFFISNLDTYAGNSGSAVFNADTLEVEGILVRGDDDYVLGPTGCGISKINTNDNGRGEDVTYITNVTEIKSL